MINVTDVQDGMQVRVVAVPYGEADYANDLNKLGVISGVPYPGVSDDPTLWVMVVLDGERLPSEFKLSELDSTSSESHG